jgi:ribosomal protein S18 acetylase RimI-like enzyme
MDDRPPAQCIEIVHAEAGQALREARDLILEYGSSLGFNLDFQCFDNEIEALPGEYAPPSGCLLIARVAGSTAGCVAVRKLDGEVCEMKRMYVRPAFRGQGVGRALALEALKDARGRGYRIMRLDTLTCMGPARRLYESLGFREIDAYRFNPLPGATYMECGL